MDTNLTTLLDKFMNKKNKTLLECAAVPQNNEKSDNSHNRDNYFYLGVTGLQSFAHHICEH